MSPSNKTSGNSNEIISCGRRLKLKFSQNCPYRRNFVNSKSRGSTKRHFYLAVALPDSVVSTFIIQIVRNCSNHSLFLSLLRVYVCMCACRTKWLSLYAVRECSETRGVINISRGTRMQQRGIHRKLVGRQSIETLVQPTGFN